MNNFIETAKQTSYSRIPPFLFNSFANRKDVLQNFYTVVSQREVICPAEGYYRFSKCFAYDGAYILTEQNGWFAPSVVNYGIAGGIEAGLQDLAAKGEVRRLDAPPIPVVMIAQAGYANYGHVLTDMLPKLINVKNAGLVTIYLLLPEAMRRIAPMIADLTRHIGITAEIGFAPPGSLIAVQDAHVFSAVSEHDSRKSPTFLALRDALFSLYAIRPERQRRLYVRRGERDIRKITNAQQVQDIFAERGHTPIFPPDLGIVDQIRLFATASDIAGPLGAGLANIAFAPEGCNVVMIDPGLIDYYFWDFACLLRQRFSWFFAGEIRGWGQAFSEADYAVNPARLRACLDVLYS